MLNIKDEVNRLLKEILEKMGVSDLEPELSHPEARFGDYSSNIALVLSKRLKENPMNIAEKIIEKFKTSSLSKVFDLLESERPRSRRPEDSDRRASKDKQNSKSEIIDRVEVTEPGFINFWISKDSLITHLNKVLGGKEKIAKSARLQSPFGKADGGQAKPQAIMVEYAHPNTHKELHIGHMRTLITGEALARILEACGNKVFRANYQGDIGPHVAKAIFGIQVLMKEENLTLNEIEKCPNIDKAHFLGRGYARGNENYESHKTEIDELNTKLYEKSKDVLDLYERTRRWSLDYYDEFYTRFYTKFDRLFFESEMVDCGKKIVLDNVGKIFREDEGSVVFPGKEYARLAEDDKSRQSLHTRVFVTKAGYPTYEGKEMCLGFREYDAFPFDKKIHVVASEQAGYFQVVFKALELIDPQKFKGKQHHLSMGMVHLIDRKMSSRAGEILTVDWLIDEVGKRVKKLFSGEKNEVEDPNKLFEQIAIGAIKYSVLNVGVKQDVGFDVRKSVSLDGNSGPYIQYTFARTQSVLAKLKTKNLKLKTTTQNLKIKKLEPEEEILLRTLYKFSEAVEEAAWKLSPNILCSYLFDLCQKFNLFYQKYPIIKAGEKRDFRLALTEAVGITIKNGLHLLGIEAPEHM